MTVPWFLAAIVAVLGFLFRLFFGEKPKPSPPVSDDEFETLDAILSIAFEGCTFQVVHDAEKDDVAILRDIEQIAGPQRVTEYLSGAANKFEGEKLQAKQLLYKQVFGRELPKPAATWYRESESDEVIVTTDWKRLAVNVLDGLEQSLHNKSRMCYVVLCAQMCPFIIAFNDLLSSGKHSDLNTNKISFILMNGGHNGSGLSRNTSVLNSLASKVTIYHMSATTSCMRWDAWAKTGLKGVRPETDMNYAKQILRKAKQKLPGAVAEVKYAYLFNGSWKEKFPARLDAVRNLDPKMSAIIEDIDNAWAQAQKTNDYEELGQLCRQLSTELKSNGHMKDAGRFSITASIFAANFVQYPIHDKTIFLALAFIAQAPYFKDVVSVAKATFSPAGSYLNTIPDPDGNILQVLCEEPSDLMDFLRCHELWRSNLL